MEKSIKNKPISAVMAVSLVIFTLMFSLQGCFLFRIGVESIEFDGSDYSLKIDESVDLTDKISVQPAAATNKVYSLSSSNNGILQINGKKIKGLAKGSVTLTATTEDGNKVASANVTVNFADVSEVKIIHNGNLIQEAENASSVEFDAEFNAAADPNGIVEWLVNNEQQRVSSNNFIFTPQSGEAGSYIIKAQILSGGRIVEGEETVNVYKPFLAAPIFEIADETKLTQSDDYTAAVFNLSYTNHPDNPLPVIEWQVNGETMQKGGESFSFTPLKAGTYEIGVKVNGIAVLIKDFQNASYQLTAKGIVKPTNVKVDFDKSYPKILVSWDGAVSESVHYQVKIKNNTGGKVEERIYASNDTEYASRFEGNNFNAQDFIDIASSYTVFVKSLGDDTVFMESDYSVGFTTTKVDKSAALPYLTKNYFNGNYFISSPSEIYDLVAYEMNFRGTVSKVNFDLYIGYSASPYEIMDEMNAARLCTHLTAGYDLEYGQKYTTGNVYYYNFYFTTIPNIPTAISRGDGYSALDALRPHVNYDTAKVRDKNYVFPIESKPSQAVTTSDELRFVAENGGNPVPKANSDAAKMLVLAKNILRQIVTDDMTDVEKAHAIYDWIMWSNTYDEYALTLSLPSQFIAYPAYYMEGVFNDGFAVCDGISKAFSLMANIEGIPTMRVAGYAYGGDEWGGHAWNKSYIDGGWYIIDPTWGDAVRYFNYPNGYEMASHEYFMLTDAEVAADHREEDVNNYPRTPTVPYNWFNKKFTFEGSAMDLYVASTGNDFVQELDNISGYIAGTVPAAEYTIAGTTKSSEYYGVEFKISPTLPSALAAKLKYTDTTNPIIKGLADRGINSGKVVIINDSFSKYLYSVYIKI